MGVGYKIGMNCKKKIIVRASAATDVGARRKNEDAYLINENLGLFIVADGMGGHEKGEVASWFTSESLEAIVKAVSSGDGHITLDHDTPTSVSDLGADGLMEYAVMAINKRLYDRNEEDVARAYPASGAVEREIASMLGRRLRMGTTLISFLVRGDEAFIAHVGDSRAYRISHDGIERLTHDHSWVDEQLRAGKISPEAAAVHAKRNVITRSVGFKPEVRADIDVLKLRPPERYLLCSDGLSNVVSDLQLLEFGRIASMENACRKMVEAAKIEGGQDNITAVLIDVAASDIMRDVTDAQEITDL